MIKVIDALSDRLYNAFGTDYAIYLDQSKQEFESPAFFITVTNFQSQDYIMGSRRMIMTFDILYYPEHEHDRTDLINTMGKLNEVFVDDLEMDESLNTMERVPFFDKQFRIIDDVLHFAFRLDFYTDTPDEEVAKMFKVQNNIEVEIDG